MTTPAPKPRLLICDDSPVYRRVIQTMLGPDYEFLLCESGEEALAQAPGFKPDVIVSDLIMGGMDGYDLCKRVRAEPGFEDVPIVLLTSKTGDDSRATGLEIGADDYLFKPIRPRELNARVRSLVRLRRTTSELKKANADLKAAQAELVRTEKLASLGQLVAGIAHEINNPLNYIYGNVGFLQDYARSLLSLVDQVGQLPGIDQTTFAAMKDEIDLEYLRGDLDKLLDGVRQGAERAAEIVRGLRAFARTGSGGEKEEVDLAHAIDVTLSLLRHELRDRIVVTRQVEACPPVRGDGSRLSQALMNLLLNARQAIAGAGEIVVSLRAEDGLARCAVRDNGCGMTAEVRARIFDPFFTTKRVGEGTGLGLSITYGIIQEHGGRITVDSEPGKGSTFTLWLPLDTSAPPQGSVAG